MLPDPSKQTSCKSCSFAVYEEKTQTDCLHNRISKFKEDVIAAYDDDKEFFVINRKCNFYRHKDWNDGKPEIDKAVKESSISFDLLIDCDNITESYITKIISQLKCLNYPINRLKIVLYHSHLLEQNKRTLISQIYQNFPQITASMFFDKKLFLYEFLMRTKNRFHILIDANNIDQISSAIYEINNAINTELLRCTVFKFKDSCAILNSLYKMVSFYIESGEYVDIVEKVVDESKQQGLYIEKDT